MIDWDELHEAHELADRYTKETGDGVTISSWHYPNKAPCYCLYVDAVVNENNLQDVTIDELIDKLRELTTPKSKYKHGSDVWIALNGQPVWKIVQQNIGSKYYLNGHVGLVLESDLYATKEELIQSQIEHWQSLQDTDKEAIAVCAKCKGDINAGGATVYDTCGYSAIQCDLCGRQPCDMSC